MLEKPTEKPEAISKEVEPKTERLSPSGIAAIQGDFKPESSPENPEKRIQEAAHKADLNVPEHVASQAGEKVEFYKLRGRMGEELAQQNMPGSINVNDAAQKQNFANYDIISPNEISSVKVKDRFENGEPRYADYRKYFADIANPESKANQRATADLLAIRENSPEQWQQLSKFLPQDVTKANDYPEMQRSLTKYSTLRISGDQVKEVRSHLYGKVLESPQEFGVDSTLPSSKIESMASDLVQQKILPIDQQWDNESISVYADELVNQRRLRRESGL